jgi:uncharacterized protein involved in response to NO
MQTILSYAFRPFFLLNGVFGVVAVVLWVAMLTGHGGVFHVGNSVLWHAHEMLVGFIMATIAGFVLTAGANWTGRPPVKSKTLGLLVLSWLLGRLAMLLAGTLPAALVAGADMLFPLLLTALFAREIVAARNRRNYKVVAIVALLAAINGFYHLGSIGVIDGADRVALHLFVHAIVLLIALIAGRIVPNFTANWLRARGSDRLPANNALHDRLALLLTIAVGLSASFATPNQLTGYLALAAAIAHAVRLSRWHGMATTAEPLLLALHVAYAWLPIGYLVLAASSFGIVFTPTVALHALTMGAVGSMIMAMQTRVPLGHTGRALTASRATVAAYFLLSAAVLMRIVGPLLTEDYLRTVLWSASAWVAAFAVYVRVYWPVLTRPRVDR